MGQEAGVAMSQAIEAYLNQRLPVVSNNLLAVLRQRLTTIHDEPNHAPEVVAKIEWDIFKEQLDNFPIRMREEAHEALRKWLDVAAQIGVLNETTQLIESIIDRAAKELTNQSIIALAVVSGDLKNS